MRDLRDSDEEPTLTAFTIMNQPDPVSILFVCLGNICRSPSGENVLRHLVEKEGLAQHFRIDSAGTINYHTGNPPDSRITTAAQKRGIAMKGQARQVMPEDFSGFDLVVAMDSSNYRDLVAVSEQCPEISAKLVMFCDFCEVHDATEVPDPYYGGDDGFETVLDLLDDGCSNILKRWKNGTLI